MVHGRVTITYFSHKASYRVQGREVTTGTGYVVELQGTGYMVEWVREVECMV